ncbi:hypothetical protein GCM10009678_88400 [Actinomadura kijaniata]|uniref:Uncharacterized protein n=1 Tax=Actinomadura namibiensis TaxID=182080 RepID=A0A7W3LKS3_ACTNM|nr:hypothetical protein [Actinomadura namibiensis]MBA8949883.1 hypothetical protein [Actinomadura namibiensis]
MDPAREETPRPRIRALTPPSVALNEPAVTRHRPLLAVLRARVSRFARGPLARRVPPPRLSGAPAPPRLRWHAPPAPFTRAPVPRDRAVPHGKQRP